MQIEGQTLRCAFSRIWFGVMRQEIGCYAIRGKILPRRTAFPAFLFDLFLRNLRTLHSNIGLAFEVHLSGTWTR
jgi:hypothetical protein